MSTDRVGIGHQERHCKLPAGGPRWQILLPDGGHGAFPGQELGQVEDGDVPPVHESAAPDGELHAGEERCSTRGGGQEGYEADGLALVPRLP